MVQGQQQGWGNATGQGWAGGQGAPCGGKGDPLDPANYRCLSVGPTLTKLYAMILEARLATWAESCNQRAPSQAGFRRDHRTTDHIFTLHTLVCQARANKRRLYSCFVDFRKAFDSVPRQLLWRRLQDIGINGNMLTAIQSLYADRHRTRLHPIRPHRPLPLRPWRQAGLPPQPPPVWPLH